MPHLTLRHSNNLANTNFIPFFHKAHEILCNTLNLKPTSCSSMVIPHEQYLIGEGEADEIFVHLDVLIRAEKTSASLNQQVSQNLLDALSAYLNSQGVIKKKVSVHVFETHYFSSQS